MTEIRLPNNLTEEDVRTLLMAGGFSNWKMIDGVVIAPSLSKCDLDAWENFFLGASIMKDLTLFK